MTRILQKKNDAKKDNINDSDHEKSDNNDASDDNNSVQNEQKDGSEDEGIKSDINNDDTDDGNSVQNEGQDSSQDEAMEGADGPVLQNIGNNMQNAPVLPKQNQVALAKQFQCIVGTCIVKKGSKAALLKHIKESHKNYRFQCEKCDKSFLRHPSLKKHLLYHKKNKHYQCDECGASYVFPGELEEHSRIHTGEDLIVCEKKGCKKSYASTRAMRLHMKSHDTQDVHCTFQNKDGTVCGQECVDDAHLKQHIQGMHGKGWTSRCGIRYQWPGSMYGHQKECDNCNK